jgi:outer membrane protein TolC
LLAGCATQPATPPSSQSPSPAPQPITFSAAQTNAQLAATPDAPLAPLSVEAAIDRATACSPQIKALRAAVTVAKQRKASATDLQDPEAIVTWGNIDDEFDGAGNQSNLDGEKRFGGRLPIPNPFLIVPRVGARTADFQAALADLHAAQWLVENDVRRLFAEIQYLSQDVDFTVELAHQNGLILDDARAREGQGAATASEIVTAVQHQLQAQHDMDQARYHWQFARRELAALLDLNSTSLQLTTNAPSPAPLPESGLMPGPMQQTAMQYRNDVAALHWRALAAKSDYDEARNVRVPWIKNVSAVHREPASEWWVAIEVNVPLFTWTVNKADTVQLAQSHLAAVNESNIVQVVRHEIRDALEEVEAQRLRQKRNQSEVAPLLAEMRQTLELLKRTPNVMPAQVAGTEAQIVESLRLDLEARWLYQLAQLNLERVVGAPLAVALNADNRKM